MMAAAERVAHAIECNADGLSTGASLARLVRLVPALHPATLSAVLALVETCANTAPVNQTEIAM